jgi:hypothetical protein
LVKDETDGKIDRSKTTTVKSYKLVVINGFVEDRTEQVDNSIPWRGNNPNNHIDRRNSRTQHKEIEAKYKEVSVEYNSSFDL